ncbi:ADP-ribosyl-[dinitrogen reductase] hydrolase [Seleniivibrio woodruffii]|uniref:ADP-ribosyl-[dinitrogen reductase] hydrolase n=1 Tax=Seleniivibrio woodruffii TaxID=1078050 RepID=UPI0039E2D5B6
MKNELLRRALGSYLGFAVGDALGATTEFMNPREIKEEYGVHNRIIGGGWLRLKAGRVTDDTEMSLALGSSIIEQKGFLLTSVADHFVKWMKSKPVDIGSTVRRGLRDYVTMGRTEAPYSDQSAGNGAAMRNLPVVLYCFKDWDRFEYISVRQGRITHNNEHSDRITLVFGEMVRELFISGDKLKALEIGNRLVRENPKYSYSNYKGEATGYVIDTFKTVMHFFAEGDSFEQILTGTVNQGGDADTNGALAGMLAGALYGVNNIPSKWLRKLETKVVDSVSEQTGRLLNLEVRVHDAISNG